MIRAVRCLNCKRGIIFEVIGNRIKPTEDAVCFNKITKRYVGMCKSCYEKMLPKKNNKKKG